MTWFRVDDQLPDHRKVRQAGTAAMGLWLLTGAWSAGHLTDGWVPRDVAMRYGTDRQAAKLVEVGLWTAEVRDGEPGWVFHQWTEHQPTREQVQQRRKSAAERQAGWRSTRASARKGGVNEPNSTDVPQEFCDGTQEKIRSNPGVDAGRSGMSRRDKAVSHAVSHAAPDPTRPEKNTDSLRSSVPRQRGTRIPDDFAVTADMIDWARQHTPSVGQAETDRFVDYWRAIPGAKGRKTDWVATWRNWMRRAQDDTASRQARAAPRRPNADDTIRDLLAPTGTDAVVLQLTRGDT